MQIDYAACTCTVFMSMRRMNIHRWACACKGLVVACRKVRGSRSVGPDPVRVVCSAGGGCTVKSTDVS